ncbi:MAG: methyltransferase domain-containing protein, partial [Syntrophomonadaceae bacterium]|nr:methyltransferase domain-containing protein [Syntrophomonadaceae bacterium]
RRPEFSRKMKVVAACGNGTAGAFAPQMLERLEQKNKQQLTNIAARLSEENRVPLDDGSVDGVLLALVAHELDRPADYFHEIHRVLTPGGRLVILEFAPGLSFGPPPGHRLSPQQIDRWTQDAGFRKGRSWNYCLRLLSWRFVKLNCLEYIKDQHR